MQLGFQESGNFMLSNCRQKARKTTDVCASAQKGAAVQQFPAEDSNRIDALHRESGMSGMSKTTK
jgi:hypothetical protein